MSKAIVAGFLASVMSSCAADEHAAPSDKVVQEQENVKSDQIVEDVVTLEVMNELSEEDAND
ncbi:MAG: hypothetical protein ABJP70_05935 [Erythrobacter sp.]